MVSPSELANKLFNSLRLPFNEKEYKLILDELTRFRNEVLEEAAKLADDEFGCDALAEQIRAKAKEIGK